MLIDRPGQPRAQVRLDDLALCEIGVPMFLCVDQRLLAKRPEGDLAPTVLDPLTPGLFGHEAGRLQRFIEGRKDRLLLCIVEQFSINRRPCGMLRRCHKIPRTL